MKNIIKIPFHETTAFTEIVAGLQRENLLFSAWKADSYWIVEITGH